jgi:hypothetical protein
MTDDDTLIRDRLADAATFDVPTNPRSVREGVARHRRRIRRRRRGIAALGALVVAGLAGTALAVAQHSGTERDVTAQVTNSTDDTPASTEAPSTTEAPAATGMPQFRAADGWEVIQADIVTTASTIAMGPNTQSGSVPWDTVERLGKGDIVLFVAAFPMGGSALQDANTPPGALPLSLDDMPPGGLEGNPEIGLTLRTAVQVNGWNLDVMVFFGTDNPSVETQALAQAQLTRLDVPVRPLEDG